MNDLVLTDARIADGTGTAAVRGHVAIHDGRITEVSLALENVPSARERVDVSGLMVAPGFIDIHAHSDMAVIQGGDLAAKISQGVTTELGGQDGLGLAPMRRDADAPLPQFVEALYGRPEDARYEWESVGDYLDLIDRGSPTNMAYLVPLGTVRALVMGYENRPPEPAELEMMRAEVRKGMGEGALGVSTGLTYAPGSFATTYELTELCTVVAELGGFLDTHHRSYGRRAYEAYEEMIAIAEASGCALQLAHAEINYPENAGRDRDLIRLIDEARRRGVDVTYDFLPYDQANTLLASMLPSWVHSYRPKQIIELLAEPTSRARICHEMEEIGSDGASGIPMGWELYEISSRPTKKEWIGMTIAAAAAASGMPPADLFCEVLIEDQLNTLTLIHSGHEDHVRNMMQHAAFHACSDAVLCGDKLHPRAYGTFPRYLGHYSRELGLLRMEECIAHMTSLPAARLRLKRRGLVAEGYAADIVVFDPETVADTATYENPTSHAVGIQHVLVNGRFAMRDTVVSEVRSGHALRRGRDTYGRPGG